MKRFRTSFAGLFIASLTAVSASAATLYDNGNPNGSTGYISDLTSPLQSQLIGDNFTLVSAGSAVGITWWGGYGADSPAADSFVVQIYTDSSGQPGSLVSSQAVSATRTDMATTTGTSFGGPVELYKYAADISGVALNGSTTYWLSIYNLNTVTGDRWVWASTNDAGSPLTGSAYALSPGTWNSLNHDFAFHITDTSAVPEPATLLLCGAGLLGLAAFGRKRLG